MQQEIDRLWQRAWGHASAGDFAAAITDYQAVVAIDPGHAPAWVALATLLQRTGRFRAVVEHARIATAAVHEFAYWQGLADVALTLSALGESRLCERAILEADWSAADVLATADKLATYLARIDCHADALRLLDHTLASTAITPTLSFIRAIILQHLGRAAEATTEYQRCLELAPAHPAAMLMLATHDRRADSAGQIARIRQALGQCAPDANERPMLQYALFHHLDADDSAAGAWQALMDGAASKRRSLRYDPQGEQARDVAIMALCSAPFVAAAEAPATEHVPIFIVGMPRSGTTVLERILGNHPEVASAGERDDFHLQLSWQADLLSSEASPALLRACPQLDFGAIGRGYLQRTMWRAGDKRHLINKLPHNFLYAGLIHKALPQARMICLLRDPLDSVLSNLKELFAGSVYPYSYDPLEAAAHYLRFRRMLAHWDEVMPGVILTVRYEELVREPERVAREVMTHCGLAFEPDCIDLLRNTTPSSTASSSQVREPLHARNIGAWRRYAGPLAEARALLEAELPAKEFTAGY